MFCNLLLVICPLIQKQKANLVFFDGNIDLEKQKIYTEALSGNIINFRMVPKKRVLVLHSRISSKG